MIILEPEKPEFTYSVADPEGVQGVQTNPVFEPKLFHFHGEFQEKLVKLHKSNPPQLI